LKNIWRQPRRIVRLLRIALNVATLRRVGEIAEISL